VKAGRSAGRFTLDLDIDDDDQGQAICARWTFSRKAESDADNDAPKPKKGSAQVELPIEDQRDADLVFVFVHDLASKGVVLAQRELRDHQDRPRVEGKPLTVKRMERALKRLEDTERLVRINGKYSPPAPRNQDPD